MNEHENTGAKLPGELCRLKEDFPGVHITQEPDPTIHAGGGQTRVMELGALLMLHLGQLLWVGEKKFRVTIECDPETGRFKTAREDID